MDSLQLFFLRSSAALSVYHCSGITAVMTGYDNVYVHRSCRDLTG